MSDEKMSGGTIVLIVLGLIVILLLGSCAICAFTGLVLSKENPYSYSQGTVSPPSPSPTPSPTPVPVKTPEDIFDMYFLGYKTCSEDTVWGVLSSRVQAKTTKNAIYNAMYSYKFAYIPIGYSIESRSIGDTSATLTVLVSCQTLSGFKYSGTHTIPFIKENGEWKVNAFEHLVEI